MAGLNRFKEAQASREAGFEAALREIGAGRKVGHWIWYVLPQLEGLGTSAAARTYALRDSAEAAAYVRDPELGTRLIAIVRAVDEQLARRPEPRLAELMGSEIDARKLVSSLTLFEGVGRQLDRAEELDAAAALAVVATRVLDVAAAQGYPRCAFTQARLADEAE